MAKMLQVRNVPDDLHAELRRRASAAGMSLSEYVLRELDRLASQPTVEEVLARAARRGGSFPLADAVAAIRAERDARS
jgi:plasmid stability protein